ncbi:Fe-Mn family superoxide dismutase [Panacagrimonas perspica]|uniref:Superoxide dismutase n=1 Tax=Panacagrimonas perspica TaxID=381431 RepID=A0A4S3K3A3_9GAMM|nr:superoxide dismutase [Panacagrimonas perspica]TDU28306.1 Fe-Mn family superoxide dismutase [Panacagrimonas perspica]THD02466.1 superoxide dismutase [Panacagrimonas perspica]
MALTLPELPYAKNALAPHMSAETLEFHHDKHHKKYVDTANKLIAGTEFEKMEIEEIIRRSSGKIFNNVAQAWNHAFFWNCLTPDQKSPSEKLAEALKKSFGSVDEFKSSFSKTATEAFGSGWAWLVKDTDGSLKIISTSNADTPIKGDQKPLLTCDVWEHAYYIDYRNERPKYLEHFWNIVNWDFVGKNLG